MAINRNKRSITVNLKSSEGQTIIKRLASESDVFVENYRTGSLEKMGLGYEDLHALNPRLIYCSISGYAEMVHTQSGPDMIL
jgi:crotonobetainyl-CoA:carnitine CoA-transferase CaiB-like acyl-CoA transferase